MNDAQIQKYENTSADVIRLSEELRIVTAQDAEAAKDGLLRIRAHRKAIEAYFNGTDDEPGPVARAYQSWQQLTGMRGDMLEPLDKADKRIRLAIGVYDTEQQRLAEQRQREAERQTRERREKDIADAQQAAEARGATKAEQREIQRAVEAQPLFVPPQPEAYRPSGISVPKVWKCRLFDKQALIKAVATRPTAKAAEVVLKFDQAAANKLATATRGSLQIPGIEFYQESGVRVR